MENVLNQLGDVVVDCQLGIEPRRMGNRDPDNAPQGVYRCRGEYRWLAVTVSDDQEWAALAGVIGRSRPRSAIRASPRREGRYAHHDELDRIIGEWTTGQDVMTAFHTLQGAGVTAGAQFDEEMLATDPHVAARGWIRPLASRDVGTFPTSATRSRASPRRGTEVRRRSARTTTTCTASCSASTTSAYERLVDGQGHRRRLPRRRDEPVLSRATICSMRLMSRDPVSANTL